MTDDAIIDLGLTEAAVMEPGADPAAEPEPGADGGGPGGGTVAEAQAARLPDIASWLPCGSIWLYLVPVILLLFLWLFYPTILILAGLILLLWLLG